MILSLEDLSGESEQIVGSKAWNLARVLSSGVRVPRTLVIPSEEISKILNDSGLRHAIFELSRILLSGNLTEDLLEMEKDLKSQFLSLKLPDDLVKEVVASVKGRMSGFLIIRPSTFSPGISDGDLKGRMPSFYCGLDEEEIERALLKVLSESFNLKAMARILDLGVYPEDVSLALMLQEAVVPRSSGVAVCCPAGRSEILVKSTWGSMNGAPTDKFRMGIDLGDLIESEINEKKIKLLPTESGLIEVSIDSDLWLMPSLSKEEVKEVASISLDLSLTFGTPTVVEWMIREGSSSLLVIQAYRESGKPRMKALERKLVNLIESRAAGVAVEKVQAQTKPPVKIITEEEAVFPPLASRVYTRGLSYSDLVDGFLITKEQTRGIESCDRVILMIDGTEDIGEEFLRKCRSRSLVIRSGDLSKAEEIGRRILSIIPSGMLILYADDLRYLVSPRRISSIFSGLLVPIEILSEIEGEILGDLLRTMRRTFEWVGVDLKETLPSIDLICTLLRTGIHDFVLSDHIASKQAQLILRAERRILLDLVRFKLDQGE
ncbi:MAG: PEP/pyruvate-binding domain-containing protein [Candidatus Korarchaeum sp.]